MYRCTDVIIYSGKIPKSPKYTTVTILLIGKYAPVSISPRSKYTGENIFCYALNSKLHVGINLLIYENIHRWLFLKCKYTHRCLFPQRKYAPVLFSPVGVKYTAMPILCCIPKSPKYTPVTICLNGKICTGLYFP